MITLQIDFVIYSPINSDDLLFEAQAGSCMIQKRKSNKYVNISIFNTTITENYININNNKEYFFEHYEVGA